jgi:hypothetical protein
MVIKKMTKKQEQIMSKNDQTRTTNDPQKINQTRINNNPKK